MREVVIVDAVRSPIGKRNGSPACVHWIDLLAPVLVGMQSLNVTRSAWLAADLPLTVSRS
jgi:acetyl-CoA acetyltransferase